MRAFFVHLAALTLCLSISYAAGHAQTDESGRWVNGIGEPWWFKSDRYTEEEAAAARERWQQIASEPGTAGGDWAGDYLIDMSVRAHVLRWSPGKGFVFFNVNTCMSNVDDLDHGDVVSDTPSHVEVVSKRRPDAPRTRKFVKVKWGEQRYFIEDFSVRSFCDYVVGLGTHNAGAFEDGFLLHVDDADRPTALLPTVPPEYREFVRRPIDAVIVKVGRSYVEVDPENEWWDERVTPVTVNAGSNQGLKRGMRLHILDSDEYNESVEITRAERATARGIIVRSVRKRPGVKVNQWDDGKDAPEQTISVGWRLTTSLHRQFLRLDERHAAWEAKQNRH